MAKRKSNKKSRKKTSFKFLYWLIPLILVLAGIFTIALYINAVNSITIEKTKITDIRSFSSSGFTVDADVLIKNPSMLDLKAKRVDYKLTLGDNTKEYSVKDIELPARKTTQFNIEQEVGWGFTFDIVKDMLLGKDTNLVLKGNVIIMETPFVISIPFEEKFDMTDELTDYMAKQASDTAKNVVDTVKDTAEKIIDGIGDLFS
ncbi:hypothetical protein C0585_05980 [Candidatus Woesearchaeota archaeon]|nr:MAG: hypothetical protein C0585_05980 [Candidatus Woesearchaeota archaeon]